MDRDLETDGELSGYFSDKGNRTAANIVNEFKNESKRKRESPEEFDNSLERLVCFDDGRHHSSGSSSSSSSSSHNSSSDGSTGLESSISDLDLNDSEKNFDAQSENCSKNTNLVQSFVDSEKSNEGILAHPQTYNREEVSKTKVGSARDDANQTSSSISENNDNSVQEREYSNVYREFDPLLNTTAQGDTWVDEDGDTRLHIAIIFLQINVIRVMISSMDKSSLNILNNLFQTPLHLAALTEQIGVTRDLLEAGACIHFRDTNGRSPLHIACEKRNLELLEILLNGDHSCSYMDDTLATIYPTESCNVSLCQFMNLANSDGQSCVHIAATNNDIGIMKLLLSNGADINYPDKKSGRTALHFAVELGYIKMVKCLLKQDRLEIDRKTLGDETALAIAFHRKDTDICSILKERGARLNLKYLAKFGVVPSEIGKRLRIDDKS